MRWCKRRPTVFRKRIALGLVVCTACLADGATTPEGSPPPEPEPAPGTPPKPSPAADVSSRTAQLKRKDGARLANDLAQGLEVERDQLCLELGLYDCAAEAHRIVLGGVEPYVLRVTEPLSVTPVTAPIAVDRLALSACGERARADFEGEAVVFASLVQGEASGVAEAIDVLYDRLLGREPDAHERQALAAFADEVPTLRDFAVLTCFAIATSTEFIFY